MRKESIDQMLNQHQKNEARNIWVKPQEYDLADKIDCKILANKLDGNEITDIIDKVDLIANDLFKVEHPDSTNEATRNEYVENIMGQGAEYGKWFYFPWSKELIHFPDQEELRTLRTARNRNLITAREQQALYASTLAIFGMSVGSNVVDKLVMSGIGGKLILADPDIIEPTNLNRINGGFADIGTKKVHFVAKKISEADPYIEQVHYERATEESLSEIAEVHHPEVLFDEVDDLTAKTEIRLRGLKSKIAVVMATDLGDKSLIDVESHDTQITEPFNGRLSDKDVQAILDRNDPGIAKKALSKIIGIRNVTPRLLDSFMEQGKTLAGIPQLGSTAAIGGSLATIAAREIILGRKLDSGRYIFSPKEIMDLESPTTFSLGVKTLLRFLKTAKN